MSTIDLKYKPHSYFWAASKGIHLSSNIMGAERKAMYEHLVAQGRGNEIDEWIAKSVLSNDERAHLGRIHPAFMGGEYLPKRVNEEVEIARITIASTTQDVTCVYAKQGKDRIYYRVVDEYNGDTLNNSGKKTSKEPLTLVQLADYFLGSWDLFTCLDYNFSEYGYDEDQVKAFIVDASSSYYAEFGSLIDERIDEWLKTKHVDREEAEEEEE